MAILSKKQPAATTAPAPPDELANKVEVLNNVLQQMMQTGLFHMQQDVFSLLDSHFLFSLTILTNTVL